MVGWLVGWFVVLFYGVSNLFGLFNIELSYFDKSFQQYIFLVYTQINVKTRFQTIQFIVITQFRTI